MHIFKRNIAVFLIGVFLLSLKQGDFKIGTNLLIQLFFILSLAVGHWFSVVYYSDFFHCGRRDCLDKHEKMLTAE